jgi:hypothetical protein
LRYNPLASSDSGHFTALSGEQCVNAMNYEHLNYIGFNISERPFKLTKIRRKKKKKMVPCCCGAPAFSEPESPRR